MLNNAWYSVATQELIHFLRLMAQFYEFFPSRIPGAYWPSMQKDLFD